MDDGRWDNGRFEPFGGTTGGTVPLLEMLEQHGYTKIAELIDGGHLEEARQVAEVMKLVGVI